MTLFGILGLLGVLTVITAYALMTSGKISSQSTQYQWLNVIGTAGILISLSEQWNLPAFVANATWIMIGIYSLIRLYRRKAA